MTRARTLMFTLLSLALVAGLIALAFTMFPSGVLQWAASLLLAIPVTVFRLGMREARRCEAEAAKAAARRKALEARRTRPARAPDTTWEQLFHQLSLWTIPTEVEHVRDRAQLGEFTMEQLEDLIAHRREQQLTPRRRSA